VILALLIAAPISWYCMQQWLQGFAYRTTMSWWVFAVAGLGAIVIALLTVSYQAVRAALANPVNSLRME
jgi:putative ABC transport system permease protein